MKPNNAGNPWSDGDSDESINFDTEQSFAGEIAAILPASKMANGEDGCTKEVNREI